MGRPNSNDISIGKDEWLVFHDITHLSTDPVELDDALSPIRPFLDALETECVAECCGVDAYGFWQADIEQAVAQFNCEELLQSLKSVRQYAAETNSDLLVSHRMNNLFHRKTFLELIDHILKCVRHSQSSNRT